MRTFFSVLIACLFTLINAPLLANTLNFCQQSHQKAQAIAECVSAERNRAENLLQAVQKKIQQQWGNSQNSKTWQTYKSMQAQFLRQELPICTQFSDAQSKQACESDAYYRFAEQLLTFLK